MYKGQRGFTLFELLLVLALLTTVTSVAIFSIPNSSQESLKHTMASLSLEVHNLSDEALIRGHIYAMRFQNTGYTVLQLNNDEQWQSLNTTHFAKGVIVRLFHVEDERIKDKGDIPNIYFWADGTVTPFAIHLHTTAIETHYYAGLVADSALQQSQLAHQTLKKTLTGQSQQMGRQWFWTIQPVATESGDLQQWKIRVFANANREYSLIERVTYVSAAKE